MTDTEQNPSLQAAVNTHLNQYLTDMKGQDITNLYDMVLEQIEPSLLQATIKYSKYNQSKAAKILGINRLTLRTKLRYYFDDKFCGTRES